MSESQVLGIHHPGIVVPNLEVAIRFYSRALEMEEVHRGQWRTPNATIDGIIGVDGTSANFALLRIGKSFLELFEYLRPTQAAQTPDSAFRLGIRHICFEVLSPDSVLSKIVAEGGSMMNKPQTIPSGGRAVYCRDPFDNLIELTTASGRMPSLNS